MTLHTTSRTTSHTTPQPSISDLSSTIGLVLRPGDPAYSKTVEDTSDAASPEAELDLDEFVDSSFENPEQHRSTPMFYNSGWAKALLVGSASLGVCLAGATMFKLMAPGTKVSKVPEPEEKDEEEPAQAALQQAQASASRTKAQLALQTQQQDMAQAAEFAEPENSSLSKNDKPVQPKAQATKPASPVAKPVAAKSPPPPPSRVVKPRPSASPALSSPPLPASPLPRSTVVTPAARPRGVQPLPLISASRASPMQLDVDPMAEWQRLATLGRYGTVEPSVMNGAPSLTEIVETEIVEVETPKAGEKSPASEAPSQDSLPQDISPEQAPEAARVASVFEPTPSFGDGSGDVFQPELSDASAILVASKTKAGTSKSFGSLQAQPSAISLPGASSFLVGSSAVGKTVTPILWAPDATKSDARFIISLTEPLTDRQGNPALPANTQLVVQAQGGDPASGLVDLVVVSVVSGDREFIPPSGALAVRDEAGGLLMGKDFYGRRSGSTSHDIWRVAAGAIGQAGRLMNQPQRTSRSSIATTGGASVSETIEQGAPNYLGAAIEGGFEALSDVMDARQQVAIQELADAPQLYHLPAGQRVQVFVNQSFSF